MEEQPRREVSFHLPGMEGNIAGVSFRLSALNDAEGSEDGSLQSFGGESHETDTTTDPEQAKANQGKALDKTLATTETKAVRFLRLMIWLGLAVTMIVFSVLVYWLARRQEVDSFEDQFHELAEQFVNGVHSNVKLQLQVVDLLSIGYTITAAESKQIWPFVTIQDTEALGTAARSMVGAPSLGVYPLVSHDLRVPWEQYTQQLENIQWVNQSQAYQLYFQQTHNRSVTEITDSSTLLENDQDHDDRRQLLTYFDINVRDNNPPTNKPTPTPRQSPFLNQLTTRIPEGSPTPAPNTDPPTRTPTDSPTNTPTTNSPTATSTTLGPTNPPTTDSPTNTPTTDSPTNAPSESPRQLTPSPKPTAYPTTNGPTTSSPTGPPTPLPTTAAPSFEPTTTMPTLSPTQSSTRTAADTALDEEQQQSNTATSSSSTTPSSTTPTPSPTRLMTQNVQWNGIYGTNPHLFRKGNASRNEGPYVNEGLDATGPFYPIWQQSPYMQTTTTPATTNSLQQINYNLHAQATQADTFAIVQNQSQAVFGNTVWNTTTTDNTPGASLLYPIFNTIITTTTTTATTTNKSVAAILELKFQWQDFFSYILPHNSDAILVVISNCQETFSYQVTGETAVYLGDEDLHESDYDHLQISTLLTDFETAATGTVYNGANVNEDYCPWKLEAYATQDMEKAFVTSNPFLYMGAVIGVFLWTCAIFLIYDWLVERRQRKVMATAIKSDQIVSQLFPNTFRDALYTQDKSEKKDEDQSERSTGRKSGAPANAFHADIVEEFKRSVGANQEGMGQPMARLYPNCTVFFADIAGFTAWSSARSPVQVFTLLETLYGSFDKIAHRRKVFKIETIGDCYVAVTGLPQPQPNHALLMVKFSRDILAKIPALLKKLATTLGPDTTSLAMRVGLHSGPVTAGVLRGEKARFQLFGDTVNTAARMESNGKKECIHCSQETADILFNAGKGHWVHPRGERIYAKGKGELQTFWIVPSSGESAMFDESMILEEEEDDFDEEEAEDKEAAMVEAALEGMIGTKEEKIEKTKWAEKNYKSVGWTVDLLFWEVKGIAWERRRAAPIEVDDPYEDDDGLIGLEPKWDESLQRSLFELSNSTDQRGDKAWRVVPEKVRDQLTLFILILALQYKDDSAFHNYDHACQVLMSADKMLKQLTTILGKDRQLNAWAKFTVLLAVIIGDINPSSFGLNRVSESIASSRLHKKAYQKALYKAWALLMDERFKDLRKTLCANEPELNCFRQLLVNLVFAGDISDGPQLAEREARWNAGFRNFKENPSLLLPSQAASVLEHISLAAQWTHTMQIWETYKKWNSCMFQELCDDFDKGVLTSDPATEWFQQEVVLFDKIIIPMLERMQEANALGATGSELLKCATSNRRAWRRIFLSRT